MNIKKHIPNFITTLNVFCGCLAIYFISLQSYTSATICVALAAVFDFMDGLIARLLSVNSEIGKQLDSLADMVSFGVVPGYAVFSILSENNDSFFLLKYIAFVIPVFSSLRLAKFNLDTRQTNSFIGLPTPANTIFFLSISLFYVLGDIDSTMYLFFFSTPYPLVVLSIIMSLLLVAEIPMFSLKVKSLSWKDNKIQLLFLVCVAILAVLLHIVGLILIIPLYITFSLVSNIKKQ